LVEDHPVADALAGQDDEDLALAGGCDLANRLLPGEIDDVDVAAGVAGGTLDALGERPLGCKRDGDE
jgi:hypothetical protein